MNGFGRKLTALRDSGRKALAPFFTAGYPDEGTFRRLVLTAARAGCPVSEIGGPFFDPVADGPAIQTSSQAALAGGMSLDRALDLTGELKRKMEDGRETDLILMGYLNPVLSMGVETFAARAAAAGVSGVIIPDVPLEESPTIRPTLSRAALSLIDLVAPTSGAERAARIAAQAEGFLYLVSLTGVTGAERGPDAGLAEFVGRVRGNAEVPLYVGFGIDSPERARDVCRHADGVIIGSALVRLVQAAGGPDEAVASVKEFLVSCQEALANPKGQLS